MTKQIVIPGELISDERKRLGSNVFVSEGKIYSKVFGITDKQNETADVVPLEGQYIPRSEDAVIGIVDRVIFAGYGIDINSAAKSFIPKSAMRNEIRLGDVIAAKIQGVNEVKEAELTYPKVLSRGEVIEITPVRSPRLIGKNGSMLNLLQEGTDSEIFVGKNGRVWAREGNIELLKKVVKFIDENSYKSNLTNAVEEFFKKQKVKTNGKKS